MTDDEMPPALRRHLDRVEADRRSEGFAVFVATVVVVCVFASAGAWSIVHSVVAYVSK